MKKRIIIAVAVILLLGLGVWLKCTTPGVTAVTILVGLGGFAAGRLYEKHRRE